MYHIAKGLAVETTLKENVKSTTNFITKKLESDPIINVIGVISTRK